jgi:Fic family protein
MDELKTLLEVALIQSTGASNRIEGIFTSDKRLEELVSQKAEPRNRSEQEIAGYREVLATIHESYEYINPRSYIILQLHRDLYSYSRDAAGGSYKNSDNVIAETDAEGHQKARFIPVPAFQTAEAMDELCTRFLEAWEADHIDKLVLIPMFILDFLCIHPFNDGNGRMSRLLTLLLFYKAGYIVGKYVSMEMLIEKTKETYYEALQSSSSGWHEGENSYEPFVKYYLGIMLKAYNEFESRVEYLKYRRLSKPDRIKAVIDNKVGKITKKEIMELCPDISKVTVERTLTDLVKSGYIAKVGAGPATGYVRI